MPDQPLLTESISRKIYPVSFPNPPRVGHLPGQLNRAGRRVNCIKADVPHLSLMAGTSDRLVPPFLIQAEGGNGPGAAQRCQWRAGRPGGRTRAHSEEEAETVDQPIHGHLRI
jgi:hypothetical protein